MEIPKMDSSSQNSKISPVVIVTDSLNDKVVALVISHVRTAKLFTAFDITREARKENPAMNVPHDDVRAMVVSNFRTDFNDEYSRTLTDLIIGQAAFVYHPQSVSALSYHLAVQPVADDTNTDTDTSTDTAVINDTDLTSEKRLNISKAHLDAMGLKSGDMVRLDTDNGVLSITACTSSPYETLFVNHDGRLRLNARTLTRAFTKLHDKFEILLSSDSTAITVRPIEVKVD
jgi:hypothetical protein